MGGNGTDGDARWPYFTAEHAMLRDTVRRFVEERVRPNAPAWEAAGRVPREVLREMGALGLLAIRVAERWGGSGPDTLATVVLAEELGRSGCGGFAITVLVHTDMATPHLRHAGTPEQLARWMPDLALGRRIAAVAMTEADAGSDLAGMRTRAVLDGDHWVLEGRKLYITNGVHADLYFVAARTGPPGRNRELTMFAVEKGTPGFTVSRALDKTGWLASDSRRPHPCSDFHISTSRSAVQIRGCLTPLASSNARETSNGRQCS
jgi:acyl-CoA dehydrogenase